MKSLPKTLLVVYLLLLVWLVLFKFSPNLSPVLDQSRSLNLIPFAGISKSSPTGTVLNIFAFIPLGLLLCVNLKRFSFWQKLALVCALSITFETIQFIFAIGATDITDVITNTTGGFLGLAMYGLANKYVDKEKLDRFIVIAGTILLAVFILLLGILLAHGVRFHSRPSAGKHLSRAG